MLEYRKKKLKERDQAADFIQLIHRLTLSCECA